jgi:hypothetical protein
MAKWTHPQATILKSLCNRGIVIAEVAKRLAPSPAVKLDIESDLVFFSLIKKEAEGALRRGTGVAGKV